MNHCPECSERVPKAAGRCPACGRQLSDHESGGRDWEHFFQRYDSSRGTARVERSQEAPTQPRDGLCSLFGVSAADSGRSSLGHQITGTLPRLWHWIRNAHSSANETVLTPAGVPLRRFVSKYGRLAVPLILIVSGLLLRVAEPPGAASRNGAGLPLPTPDMHAEAVRESQQTSLLGNTGEQGLGYVLTVDGANIRESPNGVIVRRANQAERLELIGRTGNWNRVLLPDGKEAFIHDSVVTHETG